MLKLFIRVGAGLVFAVIVAVGGAWLVLRGSLPTMDGRIVAQGLSSPALIERDSRGAVTISGSQRADLAYALGFAHAQDRLFQMDLLRRTSAGELSALLGAAALPLDRQMRTHRFRTVARAALSLASPQQRALLEAYAAGVNEGAASLATRPFEYLLLRTLPDRWEPEDSFLVLLAMFVQLQEPDGHTKLQRGLLREALPDAAARFVYAAASDWEAALDGSPADVPRLPGPDDYDLRKFGELDFSAPPVQPSPSAAGSNNWALAGARTTTGSALVANDMHLMIRVPNTWYHVRLKLASTDQALDITGVTVPGAPVVVAGSNRRIAWGFTNSNGDYEDVIVAVPDPSDAGRYLTSTGSSPFTHAKETILVKGGDSFELDVVGTQWGPVIDHDATGRALVLQWVAHYPQALNLSLIDLEAANSVEAAVSVATRTGIPAQNFVVGDADGHIGWTVAGQIPRRPPGDVTIPRFSTELAGFTGWVGAKDHPRIIDPPLGRIATANARVVGGEALAIIGDGGYDRGTRTGRILSDLAARGDNQTPHDMLAVQLDDAAFFLDRWKTRLMALLDQEATDGHPRRQELRNVLASWTGHAAVDDAAYRLVRAFRTEVEQRVFYALIAPARAKNPGFRFRPPPSFEGPLWLLLKQQPPHLLPPGSASWREFLLAAADAALAALATECPRLSGCTWGKSNVVRIRHPLSGALPGLGLLIDMPVESLPGDKDMPRVIGPSFGASERFAVSPGHEDEAYFHMPGGQSSHPLSPFFRSSFPAWVSGEPIPFLPGRTAHTLTLVPQSP
jgi:penicillin G amidase